MSVAWFEGFETIGVTTGVGDEANVKARAALIFDTVTVIGSGTNSIWLVDNYDTTGYALNLGASWQTVVDKSIPQLEDYTKLENWTTAISPLVHVGTRAHIPTTSNADFRPIDIRSSGGGSYIQVEVENLTDLKLKTNATTLKTWSGYFSVSNAWHYFELVFRYSGCYSRFGMGEVASTPADASTTLQVQNCIWYRDVWQVGTAYTGGEEVRWMGRAYTAEPGGSTGQQPDLDDGTYWADDGLEHQNLAANSGYQPQFCMEEEISDDTCHQRYSLTSNIGASGTIVTFSGTAWNWANHKPLPGDRVIFGANDYWELWVDGVLEWRTQALGATTPSQRFQMDNMRYTTSTGVGQAVSATGNDYIAFDDIYLASISSELGDDQWLYSGTTFGECIIEPIYLDGDDTTEWTPDTGTVNYSRVNENPVDDLEYVSAASNGLVDRYDCDDSSELSVAKGTIFAVRAEVKAKASTGTPTIEVSMGDSGQISEVFTTSTSYQVFHFDTETAPGGGAWEFDDIDDLQIGIESAGI